MKPLEVPSPRHRAAVLTLLSILLLVGIALAIRTALNAGQTVYEEHDTHLTELAGSVDHDIAVVLDRCRRELSDLLSNEALRAAERGLRPGEENAALSRLLRRSAVLLTDYADRIILQSGSTTLLSTVEGDALRYEILSENDGDDLWLCVDQSCDKSYIALSCPSEGGFTYYVLVDMEAFFRRVVVDSIYENHWIVLYDEGSGLTLQNDYTQPDHRVFAPEEMLARQDGYTVIYERQRTGEAGISSYIYTSDGEAEEIRLCVIPTAASVNGTFAVAVAVYNAHLTVPIRKMTLQSILAAAMIALSAAAMAFLILHSGRREKELAHELEALEREKELTEELLRQQEQVVHHQKLETVGTMTAGIAHEFNNLLTPIMGNSLLILEKSGEGEIFENALEIYEASERAKDLVQKISKIARKRTAVQMKPLRPEKLIGDVLGVAASSIPGNVAVERRIGTAALLRGDENQLEYMLLNLLINAVQAMKPGGGTLTVAAEEENGEIRISVSDTGPGIPEEHMGVLFDPFFTTKEAGQGTGLGLAIAQRTAIDHGGRLTAENLPAGGARFTFAVPVYTP